MRVDLGRRNCRYTEGYQEYDIRIGTKYHVKDVGECITDCARLGYLRTLQVAVVVDDSSYTIDDQEIEEDIAFASDWLFRLTGTTMETHGIKHIAAAPEVPGKEIDAYVDAHRADPPHFVMVMAADTDSVRHGGYAKISSVQPGHCNNFRSPRFGSGRVYGAMVDWTHRYGACGYDKEHYEATLEWSAVDDVSLPDGSCGGHDGVPCVFNDLVGYNVCSNFGPELPFLQHPRALVHSVFIHEVMHAFGTTESTDHFGTPDCTESMDDISYREGGLAIAQEFCGICPDVFERFVAGYEPCD